MFFLFFSCSSNNDEGTTPIASASTQYTFRPPTWLQGAWVKYYSNSSDVERSYRFRSDNVIFYEGTLANHSSSIDYNLMYGKQLNTANYTYTVKDETTTNSYIISKTQVVSGQTLINREYFIKTANNKFIYNANGSTSSGENYTKI